MPTTAAIPQTAPLGNEKHQVCDDRAAAIDADTTVTNLHIRQTEREYNKRKLFYEDGVATADEATDSKKQKIPVEVASVLDTYGDALRCRLITQRNLDTHLDARFDAQTQTLTQALGAMVSAGSARRYDAQLLGAPVPKKGTAVLRPLPIVTAGMQDALTTPAVPAPNVRDMCPNTLFPTNCTELMNLTQEEVGDLMAWYNHEFGIVATDDVTERRAKFLEWIQWG